MLLLLAIACAQPDCDVHSTVPGYEPLCDEATWVSYTGETRFFLPGTDGLLTAYLPETVEEITYGGTSGNPLILQLEVEGQILETRDRGTTLTVGSLGADAVDLQVSAELDGGQVRGSLTAPVVSRD